ncbi:hypothetical protein B0T21DRAFT_382713 [Apiosordaria backusii]|uniref:Uncharacterized protein n=1 Tax=Apiosordaria backusii TaxID=314023 RepID=A0AA40BSV4_9PEZI|nr:hypothetical protein B0T21DRAFT_382713 [Apiosordaria backusii]
MGSTPPPRPPKPSATDLLRAAWANIGQPGPVPHPEPETEAQPQHPQPSFLMPEAGPEPSPMVAPPSSRRLPRRSAVEIMQEAIGLNNFLTTQSDHSAAGLTLSTELPTELPVVGNHHHSLEMEYEHLPTTVAPSDLTTSADLSRGIDEGPTMSNPLFSVHDAEPLVTEAVESDHEATQDIDENPIELRQFVVTLPMAANTRSLYVDTIAQNLQAMTDLGNVFCNSASQIPDDTLTAKIDSFFKRLNDLVDLPAFDDDTFHRLDSEGMLKHAINSNSKFSFVYEFLKSLRWLNLRILILSRPGRPLKYLEEIISQEIPLSQLNKTYAVLSTKSPEHVSQDTSVILAEAGQDLSNIGGEVDVVVLFDDEARQVNLPSKISCDSTIFLSLATICSLEHILLQLRETTSFPDMSPLEIRNALCQVTALLVKHLKDPQHAPPPHEVAVTFASFLENPENDIDYVSQPLPISVEDMWEPQPQTQGDNGEMGRRKRPLDDEQDVIPKRRKTARASSSVHMTELLRDTLARHPVDNNNLAELAQIPVAQLEALAFQIFKLESRCGDLTSINSKLRDHTEPLEKELESWRGTLNKLHERYTDALNDRSKFEKECKQAKKDMAIATDKLEASKAEIASLKEQNKTLESKLAEATLAMEQSTIPDIARFAQLEKELAETKARAEKAEKKAASLTNEADFVRQEYQKASSYKQEQSDEMNRLREEIADLKTRANDNIVRIQQIHAQNGLADHQRQLAELQAMVRDRERELDILRAENQQLKNGRRETRGGSTPRSPRIGAMGGVMPSPRPGRAGAGSRGTSPAAAASSDPAAPGMSYAPAGANGRWNHLRD